MTKLPLLDVPDLAFPDRWDRRLNTCDSPAALADELRPHRTDLHARRYLQATLATGETVRVLEALKDLEQRDARGVEGARNCALIRLGRYSEVLTAPRAPGQTSTALDLENVLEDEIAQANACAQLGLHGPAIMHLHAVKMLARALNMHYRLQWSCIEAGRIETLRGEPNSASLAEALTMLPMSSRRETWGLRNLSETQMAEGDYALAWTTLMDMPSASLGDLPLFLAALLRIPKFREESQTALGTYAPLARAVWALREGRAIDLLDLKLPEDEFARGYAEILRGIAMCRLPASRAQGTMLLQRLMDTSLGPDQKLMVSLSLAAVMAEQDLGEAAQVFQTFQRAAKSLPVIYAVFEFLRDVAPDWLSLAALAPFPHRDLTPLLGDLPLLTGGSLQIGNAVYKLPGQAGGSVQLVMAGFRRQPQRLQDGAQQRYTRALEALGVKSVVNLGSLLRQLILIGARMPYEHRSGWEGAFITALTLLDSKTVRSQILSDSQVKNFLR